MEKIIKNLDLQSEGVWYALAWGTVSLIIMLFMRKRISWREIFFIFGVIGYITWMIDMVVAKTFDLFDLGNPKIEGLGDIFTFGIIPSALSVIFLNYYKPENKWGLAVLFSALSFLFEWGMVQVGYMKLKDWTTWWSIPVYLVMYVLVIPWILDFLRKDRGIPKV
jgi:hypothetical protein